MRFSEWIPPRFVQDCEREGERGERGRDNRQRRWKGQGQRERNWMWQIEGEEMKLLLQKHFRHLDIHMLLLSPQTGGVLPY